MAKITRGEFLGMGALLAGAVQAGEARSLDEPTPLDPPGGEPDLVVLNARVYTMDEAQPRAEAFAVRNGRFVAVGRTSAPAAAQRCLLDCYPRSCSAARAPGAAWVWGSASPFEWLH